MKQNNWYNHYNFLIFDQIDSTNDEAKRLCKAGVTEDFLIWGKSQTKGRGRYGKYWVSPEGNLYVSVLLKPKFNAQKATELSFLTAVSAGDAIMEYLDEGKLEYKWPNDLILNNKKVGGILLESSTQHNSDIVDWLVIGLGVNITSHPKENIAYQVTSLMNENIKTNCEKLLNEFMKNFFSNFLKWQEEGFEFIREKWLSKALGFNDVLTVNIGKNRISGVFKDLNINGNLELSLASGEICQISTGEIYNNNYEEK